MPTREPLRLSILVALVAACALAGCGNPRTSDRDIDFVGVADASEIVATGSGLFGGRSAGTWLDPRSAREFREGHLPGAVHFPIETARERHADLDVYGTIVVYGNDYNDPVAIAMTKTLLELGHSNVHTLRGGIRAWQEAGNELERPASPPPSRP